MTNISRPRTRRLTIIAQDPSVKVNGKILTTEVDVPAEEIASGPRGYRVQVIDYDTSTGVLYQPLEYPALQNGCYIDPFKEIVERATSDDTLLNDPHFHQQNVYAIVMKTLARFEFALGRRLGWGFPGHQINVAPHAFADANAFYSKRDQALVFGYFRGLSGETVYSCLSHDVVAHETTHALLDGLRNRYTDPSSPEQAGFHEGFADVVALLSVFSLKEIVKLLLKSGPGAPRIHPNELISPRALSIETLKSSVLLGLADQMGAEMGVGVRGDRSAALRRSVKLKPIGKKDDPQMYQNAEEFQEPHRRGEILVAAMLNAFLTAWEVRIEKLKRGRPGAKLDLQLVVDEGSAAADQLLTIAIRALDYAPPTDLQFSDYLSALLTADRELMPDDSKYGYRALIRNSFKAYGVDPANVNSPDGTWDGCNATLTYDRSHFESMLRDPDEVFRFIWENRGELGLVDQAYTKVISVRPCLRIGLDGFALRETVAEYIQMVTLQAQELQLYFDPPIGKPEAMPADQEVTIYGGGTLVFDEYGKLKYHVFNRLNNSIRQTPRLRYLWKWGYFQDPEATQNAFARLHLGRALTLNLISRRRFKMAIKTPLKPASLTLRAYQVGFGDCFLLTFKYPKAKKAERERHVLIDFGSTGMPQGVTSNEQMMKVAQDIQKRSGGKLNIVVATHRHKDHISGFTTNKDGSGTGEIIAALKPDIVIQPWTENPLAKDPPANKSKKKPQSTSGALAATPQFISSLDDMNTIAEAANAEVMHLTSSKFRVPLDEDLTDQIAFLSDDNGLPNRLAVANLAEMGKNHYVSYGYDLDLNKVLPGVKAHFLGPPTLDQHAEIQQERSTDKNEFWMLQAAARGFWQLQAATGGLIKDFTSGNDQLFPEAGAYQNYFPRHTRWFIRQLRTLRGQQLEGLVRILDKAMNNTSVILLLEVGGKKLLFPGDAQIENWEYALSKEDNLKLLEDVHLYKVGHHGSRNATPRTLWNNFAQKLEAGETGVRLQTMVSTMKGKHGHAESHTEVPRATLVKELTGFSDYQSTENAAEKNELYVELEITF